MADNTVLSTNVGTGDRIATLDIGTFSGDANTKVQAVALMGAAGTEGAYTAGLIGGDAANGIDVDVTRLPALVAGAATIGSVNQAGTWNIGTVTTVTAVTAISNALPAGNNNIGDVDIASAIPTGANTIGSIASITTSVVPGTGATNLGKAEDAVHASGDVGVFALAVRQDTATQLAGTDGDYTAFITDASGRLHVNPGTVTVAAHAVTNAGTFVVQENGAALTALQLIDNIVVLEDVAHVSGDSGVMALAVRRDANTVMVSADGDYSPLQTDANGGLKVSIIAGAGSGGTASTDDGAFTVAVGSGTPMMGFATTDAVDSGDVGVVAMTLNRSLHVTLRDSVGDSCMDDANNALRVNIIAGAGSGGTAMTDDAAFTPGSTSITPMGAMFDNVSPDSVDEGDGGVLRMSGNRSLYVSIRDNAGNERGLNIDASGQLAVTNAGTFSVQTSAQVPGTGATNLGKAIDSVQGATDTGVASLAVRDDALTTLTPVDGDWTVLRTNSVGALWVEVTNGIQGIAEDAASAGGETGLPILVVRRDSASSGVSADGDWANLSVDSSGNLRTTGVPSVTEDAASAGGESLVLVGAVRQDTLSSSVSADGDYGNLKFNNVGRLWVSATIDAAIAAGANTIGSLASITTSVVPGTAATNLGKAEDAAHASGDTGVFALAVRTDTAAASSGTTGDYEALHTDANGKLWVNAEVTVALPTGANTIGSVASITTSVTPGTAAANLGKAEDAAHASGDVGIMALAVRTDTLAASSGTTGDYEAFHTDSLGALWTRGAVELVDDAAFTPATSRGVPVMFQADETATDSVDEGDAGVARITLDRKVIIADYVHAAAGGSSLSSSISTAAVLSAVVKASPGRVFSIQCFNLNAAARYVRLYNQTGAPAAGDNANIIWRGIIPGNTAGAGFTVPFPKGVQFTTGIGIRATTDIADTGTGALAANELVFNVDYA